jgi:hypothetical protein
MFIDDLRDPPDSGWVVMRNSEDAIACLNARGCPEKISFDHDLGGDDIAMVVVKYLVEKDMDDGGTFIPPWFTFLVHSANPVGARNIDGYLRGYLQHKNTNTDSSLFTL